VTGDQTDFFEARLETRLIGDDVLHIRHAIVTMNDVWPMSAGHDMVAARVQISKVFFFLPFFTLKTINPSPTNRRPCRFILFYTLGNNNTKYYPLVYRDRIPTPRGGEKFY
jgi:hypothetical protein